MGKTKIITEKYLAVPRETLLKLLSEHRFVTDIGGGQFEFTTRRFDIQSMPKWFNIKIEE